MQERTGIRTRDIVKADLLVRVDEAKNVARNLISALRHPFSYAFNVARGLVLTTTVGVPAYAIYNHLNDSTPIVEAARICETERRDVIFSQFTLELKEHNAQGNPLPDGTEFFVLVNPEYVNRNAIPAGRIVIGRVNGSENVLLRKQDPKQEVDYVQSLNSKDFINHLDGPKNDDKLDPLCNLKRPALGAWMIISLGVVGGERILTYDPQYVTFNDIGEMRGKIDKAWFHKQPEEIIGQPIPTPTQIPTATPTKVPVKPEKLPNTGPGDSDFGAGYCLAVNDLRGNPPSTVCPDDVLPPGRTR